MVFIFDLNVRFSNQLEYFILLERLKLLALSLQQMTVIPQLLTRCSYMYNSYDDDQQIEATVALPRC